MGGVTIGTEHTSRKRYARPRQREGLAGKLFAPQTRVFVLCAFLLIVFFTGGSSRADMPSLIILRPISLLVLGYGLLTLSLAHVRNDWPLVAITVGAVALAALHLIPLPPELWYALPGRENLMEIDRLLGLDGLWRPLTLDPQATRNALMALAIPCAVLVLGVQLDARGHEMLLTFTLGLGVVTAIWALLQVMGNPRGPLYLYQITNHGLPVGLFANRNHQAVFLASLVPLAYCWVQLAHGSWTDLASSKGRRSIVAGICGLLFVPLILIAGSRAGFLTLILAACATAALAAFTPKHKHKRERQSELARLAPAAGGVFALAGLALLTIGLGRDRAFERLIGATPVADTRADLIPAVWDIARANFPWGAGVGSFDDVYRMYEPDTLLMSAYVNHAHNDFLEILMTGGLVGGLILAFAIALAAARAWAIARGGRAEMRANTRSAAALIALAVLFVASLVDYPLRAPALASYAVLLALWSGGQQVSKPPGI